MGIAGIKTKPNHEPPRHGDIRDSYANCSHAREEFGYTPRYNLNTGLKETIQWYQQRIKV